MKEEAKKKKTGAPSKAWSNNTKTRTTHKKNK